MSDKPSHIEREMSAEHRELYERLGKLAHFIRRQSRYQGSSLHTVDVQQAAYLKLMQGHHSDTLRHNPKQLWAYASSVVGSILEDWRRAKSALKRGQGQTMVSLDASADDSTHPAPQIEDSRAESAINSRWAGVWLTKEFNAFIEGETSATQKDPERRRAMVRAYWLHFVVGCTHEEVASMLELPNKQVAWRYVDFVDRHLRRRMQQESPP